MIFLKILNAAGATLSNERGDNLPDPESVRKSSRASLGRVHMPQAQASFWYYEQPFRQMRNRVEAYR